MAASTPFSKADFQRFIQEMARLGGAPVPQPLVQVKTELSLPDLLVPIHGYWKSKVFELHRDWKEVTNDVENVESLDKRDIDAEKEASNFHKMPIFKLGDRVRIVGDDIRMYKILHKKVGIWRADLMRLIGKEAIVMNLSSHFAVTIALIENGNLFQVNGYALEKTDNYSEEGIWANETGFQRNDEVVIGVDISVLTHLQANSRKTPIGFAAQLRGYIGRVMCCYQEEVVVTFDEINHEVFNPAALSRYNDDENGKGKKLAKATLKDDLRVGTKVRVISDGNKVMALQRGHGEWKYKMTKFVGKEGVVIDNKGNADVIVKFSPFESYRMNRKALDYGNKKVRSRNVSGSSDFETKPFVVGDILQLNVTILDLRSTFQLLRIPIEFLSVISECMTFVGYLDDFKAVVDIGNGRELLIDIHHLAKLQDPTEVIKVKKADNSIKVGSEVQLFTGPKRYVKTILKDFKPGFEYALDHVGTIVGYDKSGNAIIKYDDDKLYSVPDDYICSPRKFWNEESDESGFRILNWERRTIRITSPGSVSSLEAKVLNTVTEVLENESGQNVGEWTAKTRGGADDKDPRTIAVTFPTFPESFDAFEQQLRDQLALKNCTLEKLYNHTFMVSCGQCSFQMVFGDEESIDAQLQQVQETTDEDTKPPPPVLGRSVSINDRISEQKIASNAAIPFGAGSYNIPIPEGVGQIVLQLGGAGRHQQSASQHAHAQPSTNASVVVQGGSPNITVNSGRVQENNVTINKSSVRSVNVQQPSLCLD